ncbi:S10 family peptidase [Methyloceanibacter sp.]|uniref:S10 family peptidase n=1 Tax=Methyloceanibacter sp. TaxID=1965321 RepID=UPI002D665C83|nr:peptidase S10 [Methyloceanibacter sp.]HZP09395.1 peptidase S10 [Methyloceanibacter sp.]
MTKAYRSIACALGLGACLLILAFLAPAPAENVGHAPATEASAPSAPHAEQPDAKPEQSAAPDLLPPTSVTHHAITLSGAPLPYSATAGTLLLRDDQGKTIASIFYVAYVKEPLDTKRPVTFVFNGGPGASSAYLHLGAMGPKAIEVTDKGEVVGPPSRLSDNDSSWLDFTDLVFVDPVGTGYSRAAQGKDERDFFGVEHDTEYLADFIRSYLIDNARLSSPLFLAGESYGGFRAATITRDLQKKGGASPSGLVLISPALEFALLNGEDYDPLTWALLLPSYAAVNVESKGITGREALGPALKDAERYALSDYLVALASGGEDGGKLASGKVAALSGLPQEVVERHLARIEPQTFIKEFDRAHGQVLSRYDGSVGGPDPNPASSWPHGPDPVLDATVPLWTSAFLQYAQDELGYKTDATYQLLNRDVRSKWDFGTSPTHQGYAGVIDDIQDARAANRSLGVLIAAGYTDLITPYLSASYLVGQLPPLQGATPIEVENYAGGHMLYLRPDSRRALKQDAEAMYERVLKSQPQG